MTDKGEMENVEIVEMKHNQVASETQGKPQDLDETKNPNLSIHESQKATVDNVISVVDEKLKHFDPEKTGKESKFVAEDGMKLISWSDMALRFAKPADKVLFCFAALGTLCFGAVRPSFAFFFGKVTNGVGGSASENAFDSLT